MNGSDASREFFRPVCKFAAQVLPQSKTEKCSLRFAGISASSATSRWWSAHFLFTTTFPFLWFVVVPRLGSFAPPAPAVGKFSPHFSARRLLSDSAGRCSVFRSVV